MDIRAGTTDQGLPRVTWVQQLAKESRGNRLRRNATIGFAVLGGAIGLYMGGLQGLFGGAVVGALLAMAAYGKSMDTEEQREWARKPVLKASKGEAFVASSADGEPLFHWRFEAPDGNVLGDTILLSSFDVFELGSMNEWFAGPDERKIYGDSMAIVLHAEPGGTKCVAAHAGSKAEMAQLHAILTREFVTKRSTLLQKRVEAPRPTPAPSRYSDDLPTSL